MRWYYIKENYYFDIDHYNQLRITGPANHLLLGLVLPKGVPVELIEYSIIDQQLVIELEIRADHLVLPIPIVTDIRTLRGLTEPVMPRPTYEQLLVSHPNEVRPKTIEIKQHDNATEVHFLNTYSDNGVRVQYGSLVRVHHPVSLELTDQQLIITGHSPLRVRIHTLHNISLPNAFQQHIFQERTPLNEQMFSQQLQKMYTEAGEHIEHLLKAQKTSSFEYGTVFPRDWVESADLGATDLTRETVDYMYQQALLHVSETGEGWHEDIIGEFKVKNPDPTTHIDRKMIDIEPHYILGVPKLTKQFLTQQHIHRLYTLIATYIITTATEYDQISFKKRADTEEYEHVGNWRDSYQAFPQQKAPLSPYDVNCVFYPMSLRIIRAFADYFEISDTQHLNELITKWDKQKIRFRLYHPNDLIGYSLALHGKKQLPLPIAHLDESYDLFYGQPSLEEIVSFAQKIISPEFFYTPSGPILVDIDTPEFTTEQYHGKVIWPKQVAYAVAGLTIQYHRGRQELWPWPVMETIREAIVTTSQACFRAWEEMNAIPELYYHDFETGKARLYTDQPQIEGQMSLIQLWSAVGARRMMQDYQSVVETM